jgi:hypothetical protein
MVQNYQARYMKTQVRGKWYQAVRITEDV